MLFPSSIALAATPLKSYELVYMIRKEIEFHMLIVLISFLENAWCK